MDTIGTRLRFAMEQRGYGVADLVTRKAISRAGVYQWLNDTVKRDKVRDETVKKICKVLGIERDWLLDGRGPMLAVPSVATSGDEGDWSDIRVTAQAAALGDGSLPDEYAETHRLKFRASSLRRKGLRPDALEVYYGAGDSMEPRIRDGDAIMFDTSDTRVVDGRIYVIRYEGHVYAKRLQVHDELVFIESDNDTDPKWRRPVMVRPGDDFEVIGRVRWLGSWED